jgi:broad specificity phosphatase PhoE
MLQVILVRPGSTDFDQQGRIQGTLDIPLTDAGRQECARTAEELKAKPIEAVYTSPCTAAQDTAAALATHIDLKVKKVDKLRNIDLGLWQGLLLDDVKHKQPKVYRQWQEHPETVCPPQGETLDDAQERVQTALQKLLRKHTEGTIALVIPEPLTSLVRAYLTGATVGDLWKPPGCGGHWELLEIEPQSVTAPS